MAVRLKLDLFVELEAKLIAIRSRIRSESVCWSQMIKIIFEGDLRWPQITLLEFRWYRFPKSLFLQHWMYHQISKLLRNSKLCGYYYVIRCQKCTGHHTNILTRINFGEWDLLQHLLIIFVDAAVPVALIGLFFRLKINIKNK